MECNNDRYLYIASLCPCLCLCVHTGVFAGASRLIRKEQSKFLSKETRSLTFCWVQTPIFTGLNVIATKNPSQTFQTLFTEHNGISNESWSGQGQRCEILERKKQQILISHPGPLSPQSEPLLRYQSGKTQRTSHLYLKCDEAQGELSHTEFPGVLRTHVPSSPLIRICFFSCFH